MKRPTTFTVLSFIFLWLSVAGFANAWQAYQGAFADLSPAFVVVVLVYALTALTTAIGLWMTRMWGLYSLYGWMASCLLLFLTIGGFEGGGLMGRLGFLIFVLVLFIGLHRYVSPQLRAD